MQINPSTNLWPDSAIGRRDYVPPSADDVTFVSSVLSDPPQGDGGAGEAYLRHYGEHLSGLKSSFGLGEASSRYLGSSSFFEGIYRHGLERGHNVFEDISAGRFGASGQLSGVFDNPNDLVSLDLGEGLKGRLMLDLNGNDRLDTAAELVLVKDLLALDSNQDGLIDADDQVFDHLKLLISDDKGGYQSVALSSVVSHIDIAAFVGSYRFEGWDGHLGWADSTDAKSNFLSYVDPRYTYDRFENSALDEMLSTQATDSDGWFLRESANESFFKNIAYMKETLNGGFYLQSVPAYTAHHGIDRAVVDGWMDSAVTPKAIEAELADRFMLIYDRYHELLDKNSDQIAHHGFKTQEMLYLEKEFERMTQMTFSAKNLEMAHREVARGNAVGSFSDLDLLVGLKQHNEGYLLRFNSGRELFVEALYYHTGDFLGLEDGGRLSVLSDRAVADLDSNQDGTIDQNEADFSTLAIKQGDRLVILKEAGVTMIHQKYFDEKERQLLLLEYEDGTQEAASGFYRVKSLPEGQKIEPSALKELLVHPYRESANTAKTDVATI